MLFHNLVVETELGKWNIRQLALSGQGDRYTRYINRMVEEALAQVRNSGSKNVTQFVMVVNLNGYNTRQHACLACIPLHLQTVTEYEAYYPNSFKNTYIVNTPRAFEALFQLVQPAMSASTKKALVVMGLNKQEWGSRLLQNIPPDQLQKSLGGTKI